MNDRLWWETSPVYSVPLRPQQSAFVFCSCSLLIKGHLHQPRSIESGFVFAHTKAAVHLVLDIRLEVAVCTSRPWVQTLSSWSQVLQIVPLTGILITLSLCSVSFTCKNVTVASVIATGMPAIWIPLQTHSKVSQVGPAWTLLSLGRQVLSPPVHLPLCCCAYLARDLAPRSVLGGCTWHLNELINQN